MDIVGLAEQIAAQHLRALDPTTGIVEETAAEQDADRTWAILLRPIGTWVYLIGYLPEHGWGLVRVDRQKMNSGTASQRDYTSLGVHATKVHAIALACSIMENEP